ncbi:S-formylglutathione hydrolase [Psychrobacter pygoscelis]|uniref:S-formylglutathione hydrolase n=1 Tax=Psychrobacter pygoscelis TaxID=2488563 RepID=UPI00103B4C67|nr:S-formylglutathione hydrolase [Psychrobacter pygoscelis]
MTTLTLQSDNRCFDGQQRYYSHDSKMTNTEMTFSIYLPDKALAGDYCPAILYLSGLTCSPDNVTQKAHFQQLCSELGIIFIAPDTSPKGDDVPDDERMYVGQAASYYVDAKLEPWAKQYNMQSYIVDEFYDLIRNQFPVSSIGIMGHSMGGHGALMLGFTFPSKFVSVSAIAPVCTASESEWGKAAYKAYFGEDQSLWAQYDATTAIKKAGKKYPLILVDQGGADEHYAAGNLNPEQLREVCADVGQPLTLRYHAGFDHSYYFIQTVISEHILHHDKAALIHG